jgi:hypothetical protein
MNTLITELPNDLFIDGRRKVADAVNALLADAFASASTTFSSTNKATRFSP